MFQPFIKDALHPETFSWEIRLPCLDGGHTSEIVEREELFLEQNRRLRETKHSLDMFQRDTKEHRVAYHRTSAGQ